MPAPCGRRRASPLRDRPGPELLGLRRVQQPHPVAGELDYTGAQQALFAVVQSGKATSAELAQAYFNLGVVEAALGNDVESTDSFYLALMIEPSLLFPEGGSPKIRERLNEARSRVTEVGVLQVRGIIV